MNVKIVNNPEEATGLAVIIDVFRAFTVEPYLINNNTEKLIPVGDKDIAYKYKEKDNEIILIGERNGIKLPRFDYGNSPSQIENIDFSGKTIVHTTSCGTQGVVRAINAQEIVTGSLVNAQAIITYINGNNIEDVSLVCMCKPGEKPFEEDKLCAEYIKECLENKTNDNLEEKIERLKLTSGSKFFNKELQEVFPERDFYLCTELNKFNFVLKVNKNDDGTFHVIKINV